MPTAFFMIGLPGSGKSTIIKNMLISNDRVVLSTDNYIEKVASQEGKTYSEVFQYAIKDAEKNLNVELHHAIENGLDIVWDQTNLTANSRSRKLAKIPNNYVKIAVVVSCQQAEWIKRLKERVLEGKTISMDILQNMSASYQFPSKEEGFDYIWEIYT